MRALLACAIVMATAAPAAAIPPMRCFYLPDRDWGYRPGGLYAEGFLRDGAARLCNPFDDGFPYWLLVTAGALAQLDLHGGTHDTLAPRFARARLTLAAQLGRRIGVTATGDAAARSIPEAYVSALLYSHASDDVYPSTFGIRVRAGREVVPFSLEQSWSDATLPFLEHAGAIELLAPSQRQQGASIVVGRGRELEHDPDRGETTNMLTWVAEVGAFQPVGDRDSYAVIARGYVRRDRDYEYKGLDTYVHLGGSVAIGHADPDGPLLAGGDFTPAGSQRRYGLEAEARYYRYRVTAEAVAANLETRGIAADEPGRFRGRGATLLLSATIPLDRERWSTEPLARHHDPEWTYVTPPDVEGPNPGLEIDLGGEAYSGEATGGRELHVLAAHASVHAFVHDYAKLSVAYTLSRSAGELARAPGVGNEVVVRLQLAL